MDNAWSQSSASLQTLFFRLCSFVICTAAFRIQELRIQKGLAVSLVPRKVFAGLPKRTGNRLHADLLQALVSRGLALGLPTPPLSGRARGEEEKQRGALGLGVSKSTQTLNPKASDLNKTHVLSMVRVQRHSGA